MNLNDQLLTKLLQANDPGLKLSIYQPTHPVSTTQADHEDAIRFKNALQAIRANDAYDEAALAKTMSSLDELVNDSDFWSHQTAGLAVFADQNGYQAIHLDYEVTEAQHVNDQYCVSPLVLLQSMGTNYHVLDINHARPRLLKGSPAGCTEVTVADMPESFDAMIDNVEFRKELQHQSGGVGAFHGHDDTAALQEYTQAYYRAIAHAVDAYLAEHTEPLVLMGVDDRVGALRRLLTYGYMLEDYIEGSGEAFNEQAVHERATPIIEKYNTKRRRDLVEQYIETPPERAVIGAEDVNTVATEGRLATLLLPSFRRTADTVRDAADESIVLQLADLNSETESLVRAALAQGGNVVALALDAFEDTQPRALCRF